ncbi:cytochrome P450 [Schizophyllum commune Loenen D]|nr:cytochrome P450 [Schizophyllum commune Loenen D]
MAPAIPVTFTDVLIVVSSIYFLHKVFRKVTSRSGVPTTPLRGPPSPNWLFGVHRDIVRAKDPGAVWENWQREYGLVYATPAPLGETRIALFDPKALAHFYARETWTYVNPRISKMIIENMFGPGILVAEGENHKRQRKALSPAFSNTAIRSLTPVFYDSAYKVKAVWDGLLESSPKEGAIIDVQYWMNRISLDSIGIAGFGHDFRTLSGAPSPVIDSFEAFGKLSNTLLGTLIFVLSPYIPLLGKIPTERKRLTDRVRGALTVIADELLEEGRGEGEEAGKKSIVGQIIRAEQGTNDLRLTREEVLAQNVLLLAGYETTSSQLLFWALIELSKNPDVQQKLRDELAGLGNQDATWEHFTNGLPYLEAVTLETLRLHPSVGITTRVASEDDIIPLSAPVETKDGSPVSQILVRKGTYVCAPIHAINRSPALWGADAGEFKPERWLDLTGGEGKEDGDGVNGLKGKGIKLDDGKLGAARELQGHKHLMTFIDGPRMCLGRGFALAEFKSVLSTLIKNYIFEWPHGEDKQILRYRTIVFRPRVEGEDGPRVPLRSSFATMHFTKRTASLRRTVLCRQHYASQQNQNHASQQMHTSHQAPSQHTSSHHTSTPQPYYFTPSRHIHTSHPTGKEKKGKDERLSQGSASKADSNHHPQDPHSQAARAGQDQEGSGAPLDAASGAPQLKGQSDMGPERSAPQAGVGSGEGNDPNAGVGMVEQVGSGSASAESFGKGGSKGKEEPAAGDAV